MRRWAVALLPCLLLRALIAIGFMPMFGPGMSIQMSLCAAYAPVAPPGAAVSMPMRMAAPTRSHSHPPGEPKSTGGTPHSPQDRSCCPYAASATLAAQSMFVDFPTTTERGMPPPVWDSQVARPEVAPRSQSARGPPPTPI